MSIPLRKNHFQNGSIILNYFGYKFDQTKLIILPGALNSFDMNQAKNQKLQHLGKVVALYHKDQTEFDGNPKQGGFYPFFKYKQT